MIVAKRKEHGAWSTELRAGVRENRDRKGVICGCVWVPRLGNMLPLTFLAELRRFENSQSVEMRSLWGFIVPSAGIEYMTERWAESQCEKEYDREKTLRNSCGCGVSELLPVVDRRRIWQSIPAATAGSQRAREK